MIFEQIEITIVHLLLYQASLDFLTNMTKTEWWASPFNSQ